MNFFRFADADYERGYFGLGQFVLLLTLAPFIFSYGLFAVGHFSFSISYFVVAPDYMTAQELGTTLMLGFMGTGGGGGGTIQSLPLLVIATTGAALYIVTALLCLWRRQFGWLLFGLVIPNTMILAIVLSSVMPGTDLLNAPWVYIVVPKIALIWFALRGRVFSWSFLLFTLLVVFGAVLFGPLSLSLFSIVQLLVPLLAFALAATLLRIVIMAVMQNAYFLRNLGLLRSLRALLHAAVLWLPMALLAVPYFVITEDIKEAATAELYKTKTVIRLEEPYDFRANVLITIAGRYRSAINTFQGAIAADQKSLTELRQQGLVVPVMREFDLALPPSLEFPPANPSGWFQEAKKYVIQTSQDSFNFGYQKIRAQLRERVKDRAQVLEDAFQNKVLEGQFALEKVRAEVTELMLQASRDTQVVFWWTFAYLHAAHMIVLLLFGFVCAKSFLYVFSRVAFSRDTGTFLTLGRTDGTVDVPEAQITASGGQYSIGSDSRQTFYVARRFQGRGKAPKFAIPQPFGAPIARLLHGATAMNKVVMREGDGPVSYTAAQGSQFLEWRLREGEVVVFNFHNFVGISETVKLSTLISVRLSTLILGRFIFSTATGPGKLILMTDGRAEITGRDGAGESLPPERLVALHEDTRLHVESEIGLVDIYLSTAYVRPAGGGQVIVDVDRQTGSATGLGRFFLHFLWPG